MQEEKIKANLDRLKEKLCHATYCDDNRMFNAQIRRLLQIPKHIKKGSSINIHLKEVIVIGILNDKEDTKRIERQAKDKIERLKHTNNSEIGAKICFSLIIRISFIFKELDDLPFSFLTLKFEKRDKPVLLEK